MQLDHGNGDVTVQPWFKTAHFFSGPVLKASERPSSQMSFETHNKKGRLDEWTKRMPNITVLCLNSKPIYEAKPVAWNHLTKQKTNIAVIDSSTNHKSLYVKFASSDFRKTFGKEEGWYLYMDAHVSYMRVCMYLYGEHVRPNLLLPTASALLSEGTVKT